MPAGRPTLPPEQLKDNRVVVHLDQADTRRLDALVETDILAEKRQELIRYLIREEYARRVRSGDIVPPRKRGSRK